MTQPTSGTGLMSSLDQPLSEALNKGHPFIKPLIRFTFRRSLRRTLSPLLLTLTLSSLLAMGCDDEPKPSPTAGVAGVMGGEAGTAGTGGEAGTAGTGGEGGTAGTGGEAGTAGAGGEPISEALRSLREVPAEREALIPGLEGDVEILFTELGVPHVYASGERDLGRALGYLLGHDRFFTMDLVRRLGLGTVSELFGGLGLDTDLNARATGMRLTAERLNERMSPEAARYLEAVTEGLNAYIEEVRAGQAQAPMEYTLAGALFRQPPIDLMRPWTRLDVASMAAVILFQTNFRTGDLDTAQRLLEISELYEGDSERAELFTSEVALNQSSLFEWSSATPSPTWGVGAPLPTNKLDTPWSERLRSLWSPNSASPWSVEELRAHAAAIRSPLSMIRGLRASLSKMETWFGQSRERGYGSNAWAVGRELTGGGSVVAGDGHLALSIPSIMYQVGLNTEALASPSSGERPFNQLGLLITSIPVLAVGTNGSIAWSQVNPVVDITDWYEEVLQLNEQGQLTHSQHQDSQQQGEGGALEWRELVREPHSMSVPAREALSSPAYELSWDVLLTFDGRRIVSVEGQPLTLEEALASEGRAVNTLTTWTLPQDLNGDGVISAISLDHGATDASGFVDALMSAGKAQTVEEYRAASRRFVGGGLFSAVGDKAGDVLYTSYQAIPCRSYLERDEQGRWTPGSSPLALLDGTRYGGFELPTDAQGFIDESFFSPTGEHSDPYRCVIPADQMPEALNPPQGFVVTANNEPLPFAEDGRLDNDAWYLGGPWNNVRAHSISRHIERLGALGQLGVAEMAAVQANKDSRLGETFAPHMIAALDDVSAWAAQPQAQLTPAQQRAVARFEGARAALEEVRARLNTWLERGAQAESGVETFYNLEVSEEERADAVATMLFNESLRALLEGVWADEAARSIPSDGDQRRVYALDRLLRGRGEGNPLAHASWRADTQESLFFDDLRTPDVVETSEELIINALATALERLSAEPTEPGVGGFGTSDMSAWLWGLRHVGRFESILAPFLGSEGPIGALLSQFSVTTSRLPLMPELSEGDPRADLKLFPRPGDQWGVDAANPGFNGDYTFSNGPVMRMVIKVSEEGVSGQNIVPGGQSGNTRSPHFDDQLKLWLANETIPMRYTLEEVLEGAERRWSLKGSAP